MAIERAEGADVADLGDDDAIGRIAKLGSSPRRGPNVELGLDSVLTHDQDATAMLVELE